MRLFAVCLLMMCALCACQDAAAPPADGELPREECVGRNDGLYCAIDEALTCRGEEVVEADDCKLRDQACIPGTGCRKCAPHSYSCDGETLLRCSADGTGYEVSEVCGEGLSCSPTGCQDLCGQAEQDRSYIGCDYYPVFTINDQLDAKFKPAVVVANPNLIAANVTITQAGQLVERVQIAAGGVDTIMLEYLGALRTPLGSGIVRSGAYHLVSSVPVTVHQFNPLLFEIDEDCARSEEGLAPGEPNDNKCNSYSNDASLLLPTHALLRDGNQRLGYLATARATFATAQKAEGPYLFPSPGFVTVVAMGDVPVRVIVRSAAYTLPSVAFDPGADGGEPDAAADGGLEDAESDAAQDDAGSEQDGGIAGPEPDAQVLDPSPDALPALRPGDTLREITLQPGDVLQLLSSAPPACSETPIATRRDFVCPFGADYDLTGTVIEADGPVEVIAGHNCTYVPLDRVACDHLEETMFPVDTWGTEVIAPRARALMSLPHVVRVLSGADENTVNFSPASVHEPVTLAKGEAFEVTTTEHVLVSAQKPVSVAQFLVGQNGQGTIGDPAQSMAIPVEQYRDRYAFLSPATYTLNYVTVIAQKGDAVVLDGAPVTGFTPIAGGAYQVAGVQLFQSGAHEVHSANGLGIGVQLYGYGDYTSYMLPGGLDLKKINVLY